MSRPKRVKDSPSAGLQRLLELRASVELAEASLPAPAFGLGEPDPVQPQESSDEDDDEGLDEPEPTPEPDPAPRGSPAHPARLPEGPRRKRHWTPEEDKVLEAGWGEFTVETLARRLRRTFSAVLTRAKALDLRGGRSGVTGVTALARQTGYSPRTINNAVAHLGLVWVPLPTTGTTPRRQLAHPRVGLNEEGVERLLEWLKGKPERAIVSRPGLQRSTQGEWGTGGKPPACVTCGTTERPHRSKGECRKCYDAGQRRKNKNNL